MSHKFNFKPKNRFSVLSFMTNREYGLRSELNFCNRIARRVVTALDFCKETKERDSAILNLDFTLDGSLLIAAQGDGSYSLFDANNQDFVKVRSNAHERVTTCVKCIDVYSFVTASDDMTVKLWDLRNINSPVRTLHRHHDWNMQVTNIEYIPSEKKLLTSSHDGEVTAWHLREYTEDSVVSNLVVQMDNILSMKLTPDYSKMVLTTVNGFMLIVHDLNLLTVFNDIEAMKPSIYSIIERKQRRILIPSHVDYLFSPETSCNKVQLVTEFPTRSRIISSLQIHPEGLCTATRNINSARDCEWTSIHYIREVENIPTYTEEENYNKDYPLVSTSCAPRTQLYLLNRSDASSSNAVNYNTTMIASSLIQYIHECRFQRGYIKETSFSPDGRVIASPFHKGLRLLGFDRFCSKFSDTCSRRTESLESLNLLLNHHSKLVICTKFHPFRNLLVSGCQDGKIVWYNSAVK